MVAPPQPWLDGFNTGTAEIKQFVAMPLGQGYTVEKQVTGKEEAGGLQIMVVPPKDGMLPHLRASRVPWLHDAPNHAQVFGAQGPASETTFDMHCMVGEEQTGGFPKVGVAGGMSVNSLTPTMKGGGIQRPRSQHLLGRVSTKAAEMGLAAGGKMKQAIYPDPHGIDTWDLGQGGRLYVHLVNSQMYEQITGEKPPASPISAQTYAQHGYPWFDLWDERLGDVQASGTLASVKSIGQVDKDKGMEGQQDDSPVEEKNVVKYHVAPPVDPSVVRDGTW